MLIRGAAIAGIPKSNRYPDVAYSSTTDTIFAWEFYQFVSLSFSKQNALSFRYLDIFCYWLFWGLYYTFSTVTCCQISRRFKSLYWYYQCSTFFWNLPKVYRKYIARSAGLPSGLKKIIVCEQVSDSLKRALWSHCCFSIHWIRRLRCLLLKGYSIC